MGGPRAVLVAIALIAAAAIAWSAAGCGSEASSRTTTDRPHEAFAPLVLIGSQERALPMSVEDFLARSILWWKDDHGCPRKRIAVGDELRSRMPGKRLRVVGLGWGPTPAYTLQPTDARCRTEIFELFLKSSRTSRPFGVRGPRERTEGYERDEGFYLDLDDRLRGGPARRADGRLTGATAYYEANRQQVGGKPGMRIVYWMLHGTDGAPDGEARHEGDWERVAVYLQRGESKDEWDAHHVRFFGPDATRDVAWDDLRTEDGTHAVLLSRTSTHALAPAPTCDGCSEWRISENLVNADKKPWWGYSGAWGDVGEDADSTGPQGPGTGWFSGV